MPRLSKKRKLLQTVIKSTVFHMEVSINDADEVLDEGLDMLMDLMAHRYTSPVISQPKSSDWFDQVFPRLDENGFLECMRVTQDDFIKIYGFVLYVNLLIANHVVFKSATNKQMPLEKQLALALWRFGHNGNGASYSCVGRMFGVSTCGAIITSTKRVIRALLDIKRRFIYWPNKDERETLSKNMPIQFAGCVGFVDGTHINLEEAPARNNHEDYYSRKQRYGLHLQVICDFNLLIRHIKVGRTASAHDAKVYSECCLSKNPRKYFSVSEWIAGDAAYRLTDTLLTPFRRNSTTGTIAQRKLFNKQFSKYRVKIEHVYGFMKEKFPSLKELRVRICDDEDHTFACHWIEACCVLYNIIRNVEEVNKFVPVLDKDDYEYEMGNDQDQRRDYIFETMFQMQ